MANTTIEDGFIDKYLTVDNILDSNGYYYIKKEDFKAAMQEWASLQTPCGWTRVEDGLPEVSIPDKLNKVQVYCEVLGVSDGYYWGENNDPCKGWSIMKVTHWMPLPTKPNL